MLSPDVPEFVPRGFQTSNAVVSARGDSKDVKHVPRGFQTSNAVISASGDSKAVQHVSREFQTSNGVNSARRDSKAIKGVTLREFIESSSVQGSQTQSFDIGHDRLSSQKHSCRKVSRNTSQKEGGEENGEPKFKRYVNTARGISNVQFSQSESNSRNTPHSADNWRDSWRSKDSSAEKNTKGNNGRRKSNLWISTGKDWSGKYNKVKHDPGKGRGRLQKSSDCASNGNSTKDKANPSVQEEEHPRAIPPTATHHREGLSYGSIVRSNSSKGSLQKTKPVTVPEMSLLLDDQWPTLGDALSQKRNVGSNRSQNVTNACSVEKNDTAVKERNHSIENPWQVKVLNRPIDEKVAIKVDRRKEIKNKPFRNDEKCKDMVTEIKSEECSGKETRGCSKFSSVKVVHDEYGRDNTKKDSNEQNFLVNTISLHEKQDSTTKRDNQEGVKTVQKQNQSDEPYSKPRESDPFEWQVKVDKKKRTKTKDSNDQRDELDKPVDALSKNNSKKDKALRSNNSVHSVRKMPQEGFRKYKKDDAPSSLQLMNSSTDKIWNKKEKREKKERERKSDMKVNKVFEEDNRRESHVELEKVQNYVYDTALARMEQCDTNEIPILAERVEISISEHQEKLVDEAIAQRRKVTKRKQKEEKMRVKEQKLLKSRELKKLDSKVTIITRDFLDSTLFGGTSGRKANSSFSNSMKNILFSEEYPSLGRGGKVASRRVFKEDIFPTNLEDSEDDASVIDETEVELDLSSPKCSGAIKTASDKSSASVPPVGVPSYSGALLAAKKNVDKKSSRKGRVDIPTEVSSTAVQKKKVKTKDLIELDLMAAALWSRKNKRKDLTDTKEALKELKTSKRTTALGSPSGKNTRSTTTPSVHTKVKEVTNLKRGKQREGQKKKKISHLKKCMQRARQLEAEALLSILQEAKKAQEKAASSGIQEIRTPPSTPFVSEVETKVRESTWSENNKELMTVSDMLDVPRDKGLCKNEDNRIKDIDVRCDVGSNQEQEVNDQKNVPAELSHSEASDHMSNSVSVGVIELTTEVFDGNCEPEIQVNVKDNSEVILEADSTPKGKERLTLSLKPVCVDMNLTAPSENKTGLDRSALDEKKMAMEESVTVVQNIHVCHDDSEIPKKFMDVVEELKALQNPVHKKKFREYCNHVITPEVDLITKELVESLVSFQTRQFQRDPTKARVRRRYVCGLKETTKLMGKMSCIVVAPDIQRSKGPGALDEVVEKMLEQARCHGVPVIFALTCKRLGKLCLKKVPVSCFGIINYQGAQDKFQTLMQLVPEAQKQYQELIACGSRSLPVDEEEPISKESEPEKSDINKEVIAKTMANISGVAEE